MPTEEERMQFQQQAVPVKEASFVDLISSLRQSIKMLAANVKILHNNHEFGRISEEEPDPRDFEEMHANIDLAYRHLEDAAMRLGKTIQAWDGGKSIYSR